PATQKPDLHELRNGHIGFYKKLSTEEQGIFRQRVAHFLEQAKITPIGTTLTDLDKVYIGASAIIPIFHFRDWAYNNLNEILVYPDSFSSDFETEGNHRNIGGMVGNGAMHRMMILSLSALREGFERDTSG